MHVLPRLWSWQTVGLEAGPQEPSLWRNLRCGLLVGLLVAAPLAHVSASPGHCLQAMPVPVHGGVTTIAVHLDRLHFTL